MNLKNLIISIIVSCSCIMASAQQTTNNAEAETCNTETIQAAIDACILLAESAASNNPEAILKAKEALQECEIAPFGAIRQQNKIGNQSLEGHLVFNVAFADSLANGKDAYKNADAINKASTNRGQMESGKILTKTFLLKAKGKSEYKFMSHGRQELAVVAEPGGLVSTRVHASNATQGVNEWHNDTTEVKKGKSNRKTAFNLPQKPSTEVTLEITNCTDKDISVVVISN